MIYIVVYSTSQPSITTPGSVSWAHMVRNIRALKRELCQDLSRELRLRQVKMLLLPMIRSEWKFRHARALVHYLNRQCEE